MKQIILPIIRLLWRLAIADKPLSEQVKIALSLLGAGQWVRQDRFDLLVATIEEAVEQLREEDEPP